MTGQEWTAGAAALLTLGATVSVRAEDVVAPTETAMSSAGSSSASSGASGPNAAPPGTQPRPFGAGTELTVLASGHRPATLFVARTTSPSERPSDYDFVRVGTPPFTFELPPGDYWLEVESPGVTRGSLWVRMEGAPRTVLVRPGSSDMGTLGTLCMALGATAVVAATAILASGEFRQTKFDTVKIAVPLYVSGGVLLGGGIGLYAASRTSVTESAPPAAEQSSGPRAWLGVTQRF